MIRAIIIEDEIRSAKLLENLLNEYCPDIELAGVSPTIDAAFQLIKKSRPDVIFLDIEMQKETGFDLLKKFEEIDFEIIFTTAFEHYALQAIKFCALDYLLKPIDVEELKLAVEKVVKNNSSKSLNKKFEALIKNMYSKNSGDLQIALPSADGMTIVMLSEIIYLKSDRQYTIFKLKNGESVMTSRNLGEYVELLSEHNFFRVHHSSMINLGEVRKYLKGDGGSVLMSDGVQIEVAKRKKEGFLKMFYRK